MPLALENVSHRYAEGEGAGQGAGQGARQGARQGAGQGAGQGAREGAGQGAGEGAGAGAGQQGADEAQRQSQEARTWALRGLNLCIADGEFVGLMGRTGCGKTTLLHLLAALFPPTTGRVLLDGEDVGAKGYEKRKLRQALSLVFQFPEHQLFASTVEKDVAFGLKHSGLSKEETAHRVRWALSTVGLGDEGIRLQSPLALSGGEKRRVAIAGALVTRPRFLVFDEPLAGLDAPGRHAFLQTALRLHREGTTVLMVSHDVDALGEYAQRLLVMDNGALAMDGATPEVLSQRERLHALGLEAGTAAAIAHSLRARGLGMAPGTTTYAGLLAALKTELGGRGP